MKPDDTIYEPLELKSNLIEFQDLENTYELRLETGIDVNNDKVISEDGSETFVIAVAMLGWDDYPANELDQNFLASELEINSFLTPTSINPIGEDDESFSVMAAVEFVRTNQIIDTAVSEVLIGSRDDDMVKSGRAMMCFLVDSE